MAQRKKKVLDDIEKYKFLERAARKELETLNGQYNSLLVRLRICRTEIEEYEKARLSLEASLKEVQVCKAKAKKVKEPKDGIFQAVSALSKEEREELISKLSAM